MSGSFLRSGRAYLGLAHRVRVCLGAPRALSLLVGFAVMPLGCKASPSSSRTDPSLSATQSPSGATPSPNAADRAGHKLFGAPIQPLGEETSLADMLKSPKDYRDRQVTVAGHVKSACTRRGCWMQISADTAPSAASCRVTFKDYGFFVPTDSAGAQARVQGALSVDTVPAERVAHLEGEGAKFADKNPDGSANELRLVATGVELWR